MKISCLSTSFLNNASSKHRTQQLNQSNHHDLFIRSQLYSNGRWGLREYETRVDEDDKVTIELLGYFYYYGDYERSTGWLVIVWNKKM